MNKTYFQFKKNYLKEEEEEKPSQEKTGKDKDIIEKNYNNMVAAAERKSKRNDRIYQVYQHRTHPKRFLLQVTSDDTNLDNWRLIGQTDTNGKFTKENGVVFKVGEEYIQEKLSITGRRALKRSAKKNKGRLKIARRRAKRRIAPTKKIMARAQKRARKKIAAHLTGGRSTNKMSHAQLNKLQTMVNARHGQLDQLRRKLIPQTRKDDRKR